MRRRSVNGFTLIETVVAMTVAGMLLVALYAVANSVTTNSQVIQNRLSSSRVGPIILNMIAKDLEGCYLPNTEERFFKGSNSGGDATPEDSIHFVSTTNSILTEDDGLHADYIEVGYVLGYGDNKGFKTLYRREQYYLDEDPLDGGKYIELYDFVKGFNIEYYDSEDEDWLDSWEIDGRESQFDPFVDSGETPEEGEGEGGQEEPSPPPTSDDEEDEIRFPDAIKIMLKIGIPPLHDDWDPDDIPLQTFETIVSIPAGMRVELEELEADNPGN